MCVRLYLISDFLLFARRCQCECISIVGIAEATIVCLSVYVCVSMHTCKVMPGGPKSCLFDMRKGDEELGERMWAFVSILRKTDGEATNIA